MVVKSQHGKFQVLIANLQEENNKLNPNFDQLSEMIWVQNIRLELYSTKTCNYWTELARLLYSLLETIVKI